MPPVVVPASPAALVGNGSPDYLWLLSRTPILQTTLLDEARRRGYNTTRLLWIRQKP